MMILLVPNEDPQNSLTRLGLQMSLQILSQIQIDVFQRKIVNCNQKILQRENVFDFLGKLKVLKKLLNSLRLSNLLQNPFLFILLNSLDLLLSLKLFQNALNLSLDILLTIVILPLFLTVPLSLLNKIILAQ